MCNNKAQIIAMLLAVGLLGFASGPVAAAVRIEGQVQAGGGPLARSDVTLWAASAGEPETTGPNKNARRWAI